jgi:hypothetical protein
VLKLCVRSEQANDRICASELIDLSVGELSHSDPVGMIVRFQVLGNMWVLHLIGVSSGVFLHP